MQGLRVLISGGGTGGHIFPAIAIANAIREKRPDTSFLFVGAQDKMEMEKVPAAGYPIEGLWISGFSRSFSKGNLLFPFKVLSSLKKSKQIVKKFSPDVAVGTGGFASGPVLKVAGSKGVPYVIQEQNSFPGVTNRLLAGKASKICVAYDKMDRYFDKKKLMFTGNPVRKEVVSIAGKRDDALAFFGLSDKKPVLLIVGGSLGAQSVNRAVLAHLDQLVQMGMQVIWQTGKTTYKEMKSAGADYEDKGIRILQFIDRMDYAYAAADVVVSRAGAIAVSELCLVGKPVLFVPFPHAAEDHQTKNAKALVEKDAGILIPDSEVTDKLLSELQRLMSDDKLRKTLSENIKKMGKPDAAEVIASEVIALAEK